MQSESKLLVETFIDSLWLEKNLSQNTLDSYKNDLNKFRLFIEKNEKSALRADHLLILSYLSHLLDKGFSSKTISRNISSLKGFYKYLISTNQISSNPTANIDAPKSGFFLPTTLTVEETQKILDAPIETTEKKNVITTGVPKGKTNKEISVKMYSGREIERPGMVNLY